MQPIKDIAKDLIKRTETMMREQRDSLPSEPEDLSQYDCDLCKDEGWIWMRKHVHTEEKITEKDFLSGKVDPLDAWMWRSVWDECECRPKKLKRKRLERLLNSSGLSKKFKKRTFETMIWLDPRDFDPPFDQAVNDLMVQQRKAYDIVWEYCQHFDDHKEDGEGFGLFGDVGTAKTHLLAAKNNYLIKRGILSIFVNTSELFQQLRDSFEKDENGKPVATVRASEIIDQLKTCEDLSLDDVGKEKPTDFVLDVFYQIINHRYEEELPTSFSTNFTAKELKEQIGAATYRRLVEPCAGRMTSIRGESFDQLKHKRRGS